MRIFTILLSLVVFPLLVFPQTVAEKQREFDFWIGEWDVNLRVRQKDFTWKDQHKSVARIYSILDGKAILELWSESEKGINGYSLRYYNPEKGAWDLWLNWAGNNRSGTNGMECFFRHKRAECFSKRKVDANTNLISRYTFSDAQPNSVRWDDAYSRDGGKTWSNNWIMEFSRRLKTAPALESTSAPLTYFNGKRCTTPEFELLKSLAANHKNSAKLKLYNILDGCIIAGFIEDRKTKAFFTLTYNTFAKAYEFVFLDSRESSALGAYYGNKTPAGFSLITAARKDKKPSNASIKTGKAISEIDLKYTGKRYRFKFEK
ncbi:MAG: hypothetical protein HKN25_05240 [Pyrinomonadaceae bacterium]|nr:hypothetical protein [Pyrinomonadaceae bacterium]